MNATVIVVAAAIVALIAIGAMVAVAMAARGKPVSPYERRRQFLTPAERCFFGVLCLAVGQQYLVFAKARLADLLLVPKGSPESQAHLNRIISKHVDFVLCEPRDVSPLLAIELDDSSHLEQRRQIRDEFLDHAFAGAGLPLLRVTARRTYDQDSLSMVIAEKLSGSPAGAPHSQSEDG